MLVKTKPGTIHLEFQFLRTSLNSSSILNHKREFIWQPQSRNLTCPAPSGRQILDNWQPGLVGPRTPITNHVLSGGTHCTPQTERLGDYFTNEALGDITYKEKQRSGPPSSVRPSRKACFDPCLWFLTLLGFDNDHTTRLWW
ncbi:hypothetical protein ElyMa_006063400 [Elysia marginata]|uniref:Uncharacterized protein n=1 Tax=Elysia marginata TaxID=1093978 RepID=A0AAV4GMS8_9GAST|nr:hypothetical protein ElyMa_006063400 [Elysia marginata]